MNVPPPSPEDHNKGNAIYVNEPAYCLSRASSKR